MSLTIQFPKTEYVLLTMPEPNILLVTINRPKQYNALSSSANWELHHVFNWAEQQDQVWCIVLTGTGDKSFCAGMDLVSVADDKKENDATVSLATMPPTGFAGMANRRTSRKPVIAAVNGYALGGGMEILVACNIVVATEKSKFGFPEVKRGVVIAAGGLARLARSVSYQIASELVLTGRIFTTQEAKVYGLVNEVIPNDANVVDAAMVYAKQITANSPDAVSLTKQGLLLALELGSVTDATENWLESSEATAWRSGYNLAEGVLAFKEKRQAVWKSPSKL
ncbi:hypothetical protein INT47_007153 [Mucor saturninus]|uniref:Enoyl-CoA hydratase n=1 Tax=Mucor saturninus TaxID=64648 RepID=A0A8H7R715_9FUNG|nr:hypothetical protein INT47_007153 [Mucor saturninus]